MKKTAIRDWKYAGGATVYAGGATVTVYAGGATVMQAVKHIASSPSCVCH